MSVLVVAKASDTHSSTYFTTALVFSSSMEWFVRGGKVEWLLRAINLAINLGLVWWLLPGGTLVDDHPGIKRLPCLPCFRVLPVQPYDIMS
jgi:hypothetical protein